jgi:hypothetical protein
MSHQFSGCHKPRRTDELRLSFSVEQRVIERVAAFFRAEVQACVHRQGGHVVRCLVESEPIPSYL